MKSIRPASSPNSPIFKYCKEDSFPSSDGILPLTSRLSAISKEATIVTGDETSVDYGNISNVISLLLTLTKSYVFQLRNVCNLIGYGTVEIVFTCNNCEWVVYLNIRMDGSIILLYYE